MKTKHNNTANAAIIAGSLFYLSGPSKGKASKIKVARLIKNGEEKIRYMTHPAVETHTIH